MKKCIERIRCRIESAVGGSEPSSFFSLESFLLIFSLFYGAIVRLRSKLYDFGMLSSHSLPCRVISIGNLTAGGTGKTPMTVFVAQMLRDLGYRVVVISRGYRGEMEDSGGIVSDGETIFTGPDQAGDEPYLMAGLLQGVPVVVGRRRYEAGMLAVERFHPDVVVLDDAFQHLRLKRDLNLLLLDHRSPLGNGFVIPRGRLREPLSAIERADAVIFTRSAHAAHPIQLQRLPASLPSFYTTHRPVLRKIDPDCRFFLPGSADLSSMIRGKRIAAFAGLADNKQFFHSLESAGCDLVAAFSFGDHHRYDEKELDRIVETAHEKSADILVTSLKDFVKTREKTDWSLQLIVIDVSIQFLSDRRRFMDLIIEPAIR